MFKFLSLVSKLRICVGIFCGIKLLAAMLRYVNDLRFPRIVGIVPVKEEEVRSRYCRRVKRPKEAGSCCGVNVLDDAAATELE